MSVTPPPPLKHNVLDKRQFLCTKCEKPSILIHGCLLCRTNGVCYRCAGFHVSNDHSKNEIEQFILDRNKQ